MECLQPNRKASDGQGIIGNSTRLYPADFYVMMPAPGMIPLLVTVFLIIFLDALVSASEAAIYSVPLHKAKLLAETHRSGKHLLFLKESMERPITTLLALSNFITIAGSMFAGLIAAKVFGESWVGVFAAVQTFFVMTLAEMAPKRLGERYAEKVGLLAAPAVRVVSVAFTPVVWLIRTITAPFAGARAKTTSEEEIVFLARVAETEGVIESDENKLIQRAFRLNDITAADVMTPRPLVEMVDGEKSVGEILSLVRNFKHSRFPVYEGEKNNVTGVIHLRRLLLALAAGETDQPVKNYSSDIMVVPETRLADDLLRDMRDKRAQLAVVVSDYGNLIGVVGLEDILEELVGEIIDEKDVGPELIKRVSKNEIIAHGQTRVAYVNHFFNTEIKSKKTLNGLLLEKFGELPRDGATITLGNIRFVAEAVGSRTIDRVRMEKLAG